MLATHARSAAAFATACYALPGRARLAARHPARCRRHYPSPPPPRPVTPATAAATASHLPPPPRLLSTQAKDRKIEIEHHVPRQQITDTEELVEYRMRRRKEYEDQIRMQRHHLGNYIK